MLESLLQAVADFTIASCHPLAFNSTGVRFRVEEEIREDKRSKEWEKQKAKSTQRGRIGSFFPLGDKRSGFSLIPLWMTVDLKPP